MTDDDPALHLCLCKDGAVRVFVIEPVVGETAWSIADSRTMSIMVTADHARALAIRRDMDAAIARLLEAGWMPVT